MANRSGSQICSICASPICAEIDAALDSREKLRPLAARSGFSKASLSRHNRKCRNRQAIEQHKSKNFDRLHHIAWTLWPSGKLTRQPVPYNFLGTLRDEPGPDDVVTSVQFEEPTQHPHNRKIQSQELHPKDFFNSPSTPSE